MLQPCGRFRGKLLGWLDGGGLDFDRDRLRRQGAEAGCDLDDEVDPDVARDRVADRRLELGGVERDRIESSPLDGPRRPPARDGTDEDQQVGLKILEPLRDRDRAVVELLDEDALAEILRREPLDGQPAQIEVALVELPDSSDEDANRLRKRRC